jgi:hypothetical protein
MAHHAQHGGTSGLDSTTPPIGMFTALVGLLTFGAGVWVAIKTPRTAVLCVGAAVLVAVMTNGASLIANPLLGLSVLGLGLFIGTRS